jgi:outer membrane receptor protein involved in Fe transport
VNFVGGDINRIFTEADDDEWINNFTSGLEFRVTPMAALSVKLNLGIDYLNNRQTSTDYYGAFSDPLGGRSAQTWTSENRTLDLAATYSRDIFGVSSSTSAGFQMFKNIKHELRGEAEDLAGPGNPTVSFGSPWEASEDWIEETNAGFFVQEMFGFRDRVFLTLGLRMDGNSAFGEDYGLQSYPKASLSYVISEEAFWPSFFDDMKLRFAYGESGRAPGHFDAERTWSPISARGGLPAVTPVSLGNPELGPERTKEIEGGFEATFLDNRVSVDFTHYRKSTVDALINVPVDPSRGLVASQIANVGTIDNWGTEVAVDAALLETPSFGWSVGVNATFSESEVKDLGGVDRISLGNMNWAAVGYPLASYFGEVLRNDPNAIAAPVWEEDYIGPAYPTRMFNISTEFRIGQGLTLSARAERQAGHYLFGSAYYLGRRGFWPSCWTVVEMGQQGRTDELTAGQRFTCLPADLRPGAYTTSAAFWKLRSVNATYRLPESILGGRFGRLSVSAGGRDLWRHHPDHVGVDPEEQQGGDELRRWSCYRTAPPRVFTFSVRSEF